MHGPFIPLSLLLLSALANAECLRSPAPAAKLLYEKHQDFILSGAGAAPLSREFAKAINENLEEQNRSGDSGAIDWNYWTSAQDGKQSQLARATVLTKTVRRARVKLTYEFFLSAEIKPEAISTIASLTRDPNGCWVVEDLKRGEKSVMDYLRSQKLLLRERGHG